MKQGTANMRKIVLDKSVPNCYNMYMKNENEEEEYSKFIYVVIGFIVLYILIALYIPLNSIK